MAISVIRGSATSGEAALTNEGRRPFRVSAYKVNWLTRSISELVSMADRLNLPSSSANILRLAIFSLKYTDSSLLSPWPMPRNTTNPFPIELTSLPSTVREALDTR